MIDIGLMLVLGRVLLDSDAVNGGVTTSPWDVLTGQGARDVDYVVTIDPASLEAYRFREKILRALR